MMNYIKRPRYIFCGVIIFLLPVLTTVVSLKYCWSFGGVNQKLSYDAALGTMKLVPFTPTFPKWCEYLPNFPDAILRLSTLLAAVSALWLVIRVIMILVEKHKIKKVE